MNTLQIASIILSGICLIITTVLAWVMLYRVNKTEVSFTGTPVDKKEFERALAEKQIEIEWLREENTKVWVKMETDHKESLKAVSMVEGDLKAARATIDMINQQCGLMMLELRKLNR